MDNNNKRNSEDHPHRNDASKRSKTYTDNNNEEDQYNVPFLPSLMRISTQQSNISNLLSLALPSPPSPAPPPPPSTGRTRKAPSKAPRAGKTVTITPPYPWATDRRAQVHTIAHLVSALGITAVSGEVQCRRCECVYALSYDLQEKFLEVSSFVVRNKDAMHQRAPKEWSHPALPRCRYCEQESNVKPVIAAKKRDVNWLFMFLGQMLGCCTLEQLKYFCKHTKNHRTGAKDRVLYLAYLEMCKQLDPTGPFDI